MTSWAYFKKRRLEKIPISFLILLMTAVLLVSGSSFSGEASSANPKKDGEKIMVSFEARPKVVHPGESGVIIVRIETAKGIKLTRYPQTSIQISGDSELVLEGHQVKLGDGKMPDDIDKNYLEKIDPAEFKFQIDEKTARSAITVKASISYFYCETKSGFCAPGTKSLDFQIPVKKR